MDATDYRILSALHENARVSVSEMSRTIAMSQPAVTERMRKLEEQGVIKGYKAKLAPDKLGKHATAFILFKTGNCADFERFSEGEPAIVDLYRLAGEYNYLMKVHAESTEALERLIQACSAHGFSTTFVVLSARFEDKFPATDRMGEPRTND